MIPNISNAIALHFKETADVELRLNHRSSNAYRTHVYDERLTEEQFNALTAPLELTLEDIAAKFGVDASKVKIVK
jgi:hypothetical protein